MRSGFLLLAVIGIVLNCTLAEGGDRWRSAAGSAAEAESAPERAADPEGKNQLRWRRAARDTSEAALESSREREGGASVETTLDDQPVADAPFRVATFPGFFGQRGSSDEEFIDSPLPSESEPDPTEREPAEPPFRDSIEAHPEWGPPWGPPGPGVPLAPYSPPLDPLRASRSAREWLRTRFSSPAYRHYGLGKPLQTASWRNRPWGVSWFIGPIFGDEILAGRIDQEAGIIGGMRISWDRNYYWGYEFRLALGSMDTDPEPRDMNTNLALGDVHVLFYPLGDTTWRPFFGLGVGFADYRFFDEFQRETDETLVGMPLTVGLKYWYHPHWVLRFDVTDNLAFSGKELSTMHNLSIAFGTEWRFGGKRPSYWPWHPSLHIR